uniref:Uncharacterized protein n=1 Tax=Arion vulgaris TaxID=1028688 RepID=A0A0B6XZ99_9EUPU
MQHFWFRQIFTRDMFQMLKSHMFHVSDVTAEEKVKMVAAIKKPQLSISASVDIQTTSQRTSNANKHHSNPFNCLVAQTK